MKIFIFSSSWQLLRGPALPGGHLSDTPANQTGSGHARPLLFIKSRVLVNQTPLHVAPPLHSRILERPLHATEEQPRAPLSVSPRTCSLQRRPGSQTFLPIHDQLSVPIVFSPCSPAPPSARPAVTMGNGKILRGSAHCFGDSADLKMGMER